MKEPTAFSGVEHLTVTSDVAEINATELRRWCGRVRPHSKAIA
jgi:hypothetical protein